MIKKGNVYITLITAALLVILGMGCAVTIPGSWVDAGESQTMILGQRAVLNGSCSVNPGETVEWSVLEKPEGSGLTNEFIIGKNGPGASFIPDVIGTYTLAFTLTGPGNEEILDTTTVRAVKNAEQNIAEGKTYLQEQDWESAISSFAKAAEAEPENGEAVLGYNLLNLLLILSDPAMVDFCSNNLGFENYPNSVNEIMDIKGWGELAAVSFGKFGMAAYLPKIKGEEKFQSSTEYVSMVDKMYAFLSYFAANNSGFNETFTAFEAAFRDRINAALTALSAIPAGSKMSITWDLFLSDITEAETRWPKDSAGNLAAFTFGKEELYILTAQLRIINHMVYIGKMYDTSLPLKEYFDYYYTSYTNSGNSTITLPPSLFSKGFGELSVDAARYLELAKTEMTKILAETEASLTGIQNRTAGCGYFISPDNEFFTTLIQHIHIAGIGYISTWDNLSDLLDYSKKIVQEMKKSLIYQSTAYIPNFKDIPFGSFTSLNEWIQDKLTNWPTSADVPALAYGLNLGKFYANPAISFSKMIETRQNNPITSDDIGEPVFYEYNTKTAQFTEVTTPVADPEVYFSPYLIKLKDITMGGVIDLANYPFSEGNLSYTSSPRKESDSILINDKWDFNDTNGNGSWDAGEPAEDYTFHYMPVISSGIIKKSEFSRYLPEPLTYVAQMPESEIASYTSYPADFKRYLAANEDKIYAYFMPEMVLDDTDNNTFYLGGLSPAWVWHSMTEKGTVYTDEYNQTITSTGSFWTALIF